MAKNPLSMGYRSPTATSGGFLGNGGGGKKGKKNSAWTTVKRGAAAAGIAATVHGAAQQPPSSTPTPLRDTAKVMTGGERTRRTRDQRQGTTAKGRGSSGSSGKA